MVFDALFGTYYTLKALWNLCQRYRSVSAGYYPAAEPLAGAPSTLICYLLADDNGKGIISGINVTNGFSGNYTITENGEITKKFLNHTLSS